MDEERIDLRELCRRADVTPRTVRYYIQQGLLPAASSSGPGAKYGRPHLDRLLLIKRLQQAYLPLAEIRKQLESLDETSLRRAARQSTPGSNDALEYIRALRLRAAAGSAAPRLTSTPHRSQWERINLGTSVELHIRRPLAREDSRKVAKLIELVRQLMKGEEPR